MSNKYDVNTLVITLTGETLKTLFPEEVEFLRQNRYELIEKMPEFLVAFNENRVSLGHILNLKGVIEQKAAAAEVARQQAEDQAAWDQKEAAAKAVRELTAATHR